MKYFDYPSMNGYFFVQLAVENFETPEIEIERAMYMREIPSLK